MFFKSKLSVLLVLILIASNSFSQNISDQQLSKSVKWTLNEKIKNLQERVEQIKKNETTIETTQVTVTNDKSGDNPISNDNSSEAEVHAAINPLDSNNIIVSPIRSSTSGMYCPVYYTKDFGTTWTKSSFHNMPSISGGYTLGGGDPVLAYDSDGIAYISWLDLHMKNGNFDTIFWGMYWAYSNDGGVNWQTEPDNEVVLGYIGASGTFAGGILPDKQWMAFDRTSSVKRNNLYMVFFEIDAITFTGRISVYTKPADSSHFNAQLTPVSDATFDNVQFSSIDVDNQSNIHVTFFGSKTAGNYALWHSVSTDGGASFSTPNKISDLQIPQFSNNQQSVSVLGIDDDRLYPSPYLAVDQNNGNLYITWTANGITTAGNNGLDIYFSRSVDGGNTWSSPMIVNNDLPGLGIHQYYSSVTVNKSGRVCLSWYDRRGDVNNKDTHYYIAESFDNGVSFDGNNVVVTTVPTDFSTVVNANETFGNDGQHFNSSINSSPNNNSVPSNVLNALYNMSDHLPVVMELKVDKTLSGINKISAGEIYIKYNNPVQNNLKMVLAGDNSIYYVKIFSIYGQLIYTTTCKAASYSSEHTIPVNYLNNGIYILSIGDNKGNQISKKLIKE